MRVLVPSLNSVNKLKKKKKKTSGKTFLRFWENKATLLDTQILPSQSYI